MKKVELINIIDGKIGLYFYRRISMAKRGRPAGSATRTTSTPAKRGRKSATAKSTGSSAGEKKPTITLDQIKSSDLNRLKREIKQEILESREFAAMKKELLTEAKKEVLRSVVNPLVNEFQKIDK